MTRVRQNTQCVIGFNNDAAFGHFLERESEEGTFVFMTSFFESWEFMFMLNELYVQSEASSHSAVARLDAALYKVVDFGQL